MPFIGEYGPEPQSIVASLLLALDNGVSLNFGFPRYRSWVDRPALTVTAEAEPEGFRIEGMSSKESVRSTWTEANGTSMQGEIRRGLLASSSEISEAVGRFVGVFW